MSGQNTRKWVNEKFPNRILRESSYDVWSNKEDDTLFKELQLDIPINEIAVSHQRTSSAIKSRIKRLAYIMYLNNVPESEILYKTKLTKTVLDNTIRKNENKNIKDNSINCNMLDIEALAKEVYTLGAGYSERVYHNGMEVLLRKAGIPYETERIVPITFQGHVIGNLRADMIVNNEIVLEFKAIKNLTEQVELQAQHYLNLTGLKKAYLVNFPPFPNRDVEIRCVVTEP
jgi:GxxExxY protein